MQALELSQLVARLGLIMTFTALVASGVIGVRAGLVPFGFGWLLGYHLLYTAYTVKYRLRLRHLHRVSHVIPYCDALSITAIWLMIGDPGSVVWGAYTFQLAIDSTRFGGRRYVMSAAFIAANAAGTRAFLDIESAGQLSLNPLLLLGGCGLMAFLSSGLRGLVLKGEETARTMAETDPLTGLANRRTFTARVEALASRADARFAVIMVDADNFKRLNDTRGHAEGDRALVAIAEALRSGIRPGDCVGRYGGEEFIVLLPGADAAAAEAAAERLLRAVRHSAPTTVSIGSAVRREGEDWAEVCRRADALLLTAKRQGKDRALADAALPAAAA